MIDRLKAVARNWSAWLLDRINDAGALVMWLLLNVSILPPEIVALLPQSVRLVLPAIWWALVKWAAHRKAQAAAIAIVTDGPR
jgi:hypothetical protein